MRAFEYVRPASLAEAIALLDRHGPGARPLAGGTDLVIRLRDGSIRPDVVFDVKAIPELDAGITDAGGSLVIGARAVMTDIAADPRVRRHFPALAEAALVVGSAQIRNRATLAGNLCNASPAADTAPALLVYGAVLVVAGGAGTRRIPVDDLWVRSGVTTLARDELLTAIELPVPAEPRGSTHVRRTRRRGHDLASVTLACSIGRDGVTRLAYGSVGPRPLLAVDDSGRPRRSRRHRDVAGADVFDRLLAGAAPSPTSMRASPEYRLAMLRVLGRRAIAGVGPAPGRGRRGVSDPDRDPAHAQRAPAGRRGGRAPHAARRPARRPPAHRDEGVLPRRGVRRVHRAGRRPERGRVPRARGGGRRLGRDDRGGAGRATTGLSALQAAFLDTGAAQCGFCIPGQLLSAQALLAEVPHPTRAEVEEGLAGNLCRCAGYEQIIEAVLLAAGGDGGGARRPSRGLDVRRRPRRRRPSRRRAGAAMSGAGRVRRRRRGRRTRRGAPAGATA